MRNLLRKIADAPYSVLAIATVSVMQTTEASAGGGSTASTAGDVAKSVGTSVKEVGTLALQGAFLIGVVMVAGGLMKLKQAADTQGQQVKYGEGLWRLAVGAGLVAVPAATGIMTGTLGLGNVKPSNAGGAPF